MTDPAPSQPLPDQLLVAAYRSGDERAARTLVERHAGAVGRLLYSSGAGATDVEDLVQETFYRAFRGLETWRGDASFRAWLFTIAANLLRDSYRRRRGRTTVSIEDRDMADHRDPAAEFEADAVAERLREGLRTLPRLQREVFLLRVQEGSDYETIAKALGTTPGAARVHYHHAVKRLKELVE